MSIYMYKLPISYFIIWILYMLPKLIFLLSITLKSHLIPKGGSSSCHFIYHKNDVLVIQAWLGQTLAEVTQWWFSARQV